MKILEIKNKIETILGDNKAKNIVSIDLKKKILHSGLHDYSFWYFLETFTVFV